MSTDSMIANKLSTVMLDISGDTANKNSPSAISHLISPLDSGFHQNFLQSWVMSLPFPSSVSKQYPTKRKSEGRNCPSLPPKMARMSKGASIRCLCRLGRRHYHFD